MSFFKTPSLDRFENKSKNYEMAIKEYILNTLFHIDPILRKFLKLSTFVGIDSLFDEYFPTPLF